MKRYTFNRQNYNIFKSDAEAERPFLYFFWGKFDFRLILVPTDAETAEAAPKKSFQRNGQFFIVESFQLKHHNEWFDYVKPTAHGLQLEETKWQNGDQAHYMEIPQNLLGLACEMAAAELGLTSLHHATAS